MSRSSSGSGLISPYAVGQEGNNFATIFDAHSTSTTSHNITVDNNFMRIVAYNLSPGEVITVQQVTGSGATELAADYCPINGPLKLFFTDTLNQRTSCVLERPGIYRFVLSGGGLGFVTCRAYQYFTENEASQDIADGLFAILNQLPDPCRMGNAVPHGTAETTVVGLNESNCMEAFQLVSDDAGNTITLHADGVYSPAPTDCSIGQLISGGDAVNNVIGKDLQGCLLDFQLVSSDVGNTASLRTDGIFVVASGAAILGAAPTSTTNPTIIAGILYEEVKLSGVAGNLLQINPDGLYYGIIPPGNFANQYVSSSTGNDSNPGTIGSPLQTIQKALTNLPDGTAGNIYLLAGDTFHTYPTAVTDVITTLTRAQAFAAAATLNIGDRVVTFFPYNDTVIDTVVAYNVANNTGYYPYGFQQTNFPIIKFTIANPSDALGDYVPIGFFTGLRGSISTFAVNLDVGQIAAVTPLYEFGAFYGGGSVNIQGGHILVGNVPLFGDQNQTQLESVSIRNTQIADHGTPSTPPTFYQNGGNLVLNTVLPQAAGGSTFPPNPAYTYIGDNIETYLATAALWRGIVIYSTAFRSFRNIVSSVPIA